MGWRKREDAVRATIRWPSGLTQTFENLPVNHRIEIEEGSNEFLAKPFAALASSYARAGDSAEAGAAAIVGRDLAHRTVERAGFFAA